MNLNQMEEFYENLEAFLRVIKDKTPEEIEKINASPEMEELMEKLNAKLEHMKQLNEAFMEEAGLTDDDLKKVANSKDLPPELTYLLKRTEEIKGEIRSTAKELHLDEENVGAQDNSNQKKQSDQKSRQRAIEKRLKNM